MALGAGSGRGWGVIRRGADAQIFEGRDLGRNKPGDNRGTGAGADGRGTESSVQEPAEASFWAGALRGAAGALWPSVTSCEGLLP